MAADALRKFFIHRHTRKTQNDTLLQTRNFTPPSRNTGGPMAADARRKFFMNEKNLAGRAFDTDHVWTFYIWQQVRRRGRGGLWGGLRGFGALGLWGGSGGLQGGPGLA